MRSLIALIEYDCVSMGTITSWLATSALIVMRLRFGGQS